MQYRSLLVASLLGATLAVAAKTDPAFSQASSSSYRLPSAGLVAAGGTGQSAGFGLVGTLGTTAAGASTSASAGASGGLLATLPSAPALEYPGPAVTTGPAGTRFDVSVDLHNASRAQVELWYRRGGESSFAVAAMTNAGGIAFSGSLPAANVGIRGVEYYVQARQNGLVRTVPSTSPDSLLVMQASLANALAPVLPDAQYRMVGFPLAVSPSAPASVFEDDLGPPDATAWRVGRWDPLAGAYREYPDVAPVAAGQGYWVIARGGKQVGASGLSSVPDTRISGDRYARVVLQPGWNQIGSPFAFRVDWTGRVDDPLGGVEPTLWSYDGSGYVPVSVLTPFEGYWVHNTASASRTLLLPYAESTMPLAADAAHAAGGAGTTSLQNASLEAAPGEWTLTLEAVAGDRHDRVNRLGARREARDGADAFDLGEPPPNLLDRYVTLASVRPTEGGTPALLAADYRDAQDRGWSFALRLATDSPRSVEVSVLGLTTLPPGLQAVLVETASGRVHPLDGKLPLRLQSGPYPAGTTYELVVGEDAYVRDRVQAVSIPKRFVLEQNHPNPFNPATIIRFGLPVAGDVRLEVLDARGRHVTTLVNGELPAGFHELRWEGVDDRGRRMASGVYLYRLLAPSYERAKKMLLLK